MIIIFADIHLLGIIFYIHIHILLQNYLSGIISFTAHYTKRFARSWTQTTNETHSNITKCRLICSWFSGWFVGSIIFHVYYTRDISWQAGRVISVKKKRIVIKYVYIVYEEGACDAKRTQYFSIVSMLIDQCCDVYHPPRILSWPRKSSRISVIPFWKETTLLRIFPFPCVSTCTHTHNLQYLCGNLVWLRC